LLFGYEEGDEFGLGLLYFECPAGRSREDPNVNFPDSKFLIVSGRGATR